jgi:hypothetical protein
MPSVEFIEFAPADRRSEDLGTPTREEVEMGNPRQQQTPTFTTFTFTDGTDTVSSVQAWAHGAGESGNGYPIELTQTGRTWTYAGNPGWTNINGINFQVAMVGTKYGPTINYGFSQSYPYRIATAQVVYNGGSDCQFQCTVFNVPNPPTS